MFGGRRAAHGSTHGDEPDSPTGFTLLVSTGAAPSNQETNHDGT
jgi:hypothetical protein